MSTSKDESNYLHGYSADEQDRLYRQAGQLEHVVHDRLPYRRTRNLLEVGCGVGAQTEILLRRFPSLRVTGVDRSPESLEKARENLALRKWTGDRFELVESPAESLPFDSDTFDGAFLCWVLEHVSDPLRVLSEVRRCLRPGSPIVVSEVQNATFFIDPYSPHTLAYWTAFNEHQIEIGGDPFVGAKLGNLLQAVGFGNITTEVKTFLLDNRQPGERKEFLSYWTELLLSGAAELERGGKVPTELVEGMKNELEIVGRDPNAVFFYSFVQAQARTS
ncbi:MAG: ubiquinone/menaquinone biosynthesis C-methylase UbiE [Planctomycetota bacterium]|jgi:ubiquinone/menaquinone biosynthesis C-methylase UbiE